jgi:hypothetical protein
MAAFLEKIGIPFLLRAQNQDGGWGHRCGLASSIEPTSWAMLGLANLADVPEIRQACTLGQAFLRKVQLGDGSWPAVPGQHFGCWVTSPACLALYELDSAELGIRRAVNWICTAWPAEGGLRWRLRNWFHDPSRGTLLDYSLRGWSWTPGTSSWVEPTSYALILLHHLPPDLRPPAAHRRISLAERMLSNRTLSSGGWNCGDPQVYGITGAPRVGPTVWALLALREHRHKTEVQRALAWLESVYSTLEGLASLALAHLCLQCFDRPVASLEEKLQDFQSRPGSLNQVNSVAWTMLALRGSCLWLRNATEKNP